MAGIQVKSVLPNGKNEPVIEEKIIFDYYNLVFNENISNQIDNKNTNFLLENKFIYNTTQVYYNGIRLAINLDYTEDTNYSIQLNFIPLIEDVLILDYIKI